MMGLDFNWSDLPWYKKGVVVLVVVWKALSWKLKNQLTWRTKMEKPFDAKNLADRLKATGLPIAEKEAKLVVNETLSWIEESLALTGNKIDDLAIPAIEVIKPAIMKSLDKIDGVEGN